MLTMTTLSQRRQAASPRMVLTIVCAGVVLASLDLFIVNVALPQIGRDFDLHGAELADLSWILNAYAIVYAALLVLLGRAAERYRRDLGFLLGVAIFVLGSAACSAATDLPQLIAFRVVQAVGAALLTPTSLGLILVSYPADRRAGAVRAWTAVGGLAATLGPVVGGLLVAISWRWVFLVNVPVGLVALAVGWRRLPRIAGHPVAPPELAGAALLTGGVGALVLGLVNGSRWGWSSAATLLALGGAGLLLVLFALRCARHSNPLIDRSLFRLRPFTGASAVALIFSAAFGAMLLSRVLWAQDVWHWSPVETGLAIAPGPLMVPLVSFGLTGRLTARFGPAPVIGVGSIIFAAGALWWAVAATLRPDYIGEMFGGMLLTGIGVGLTLPTMMATGTASLPPHSVATGSAVVNMFRQIGLAVGVAVLIAVLGEPRSPAAVLDHYRWGTYAVAAIAVLAALVGLAALARPGTTPAADPEAARASDPERRAAAPTDRAPAPLAADA